MPKIGRPTRFTPEVTQAIVDGVRRGLSVSLAAELVGESPKTVLEWLQRGQGTHARKSERRYADFADAIRKARAANVDERLANISKIAKGGQVVKRTTVRKPNGEEIITEQYAQGQWTADMTVLERTIPEEFARREVHEHTGKDGKELEPVRFVVIERAAREPKVVEAVPEPPALPPLTIAEEGVA